MTRIALKDEAEATPPELVDAIRKRRGGSLFKLDRLLLHSPTYAQAWNSYFRVVINELTPPLKLREFVMCIVGVLNGADYEVFSHAPKFLAAGGRQAQIDALTDIARAQNDTQLFDATERAVLKLAAEMTRNVSVSNTTFDEVKAVFGDPKHLVDLVGLIASYNAVSRFVVAFDVHADDGRL